MLTKLSLELLFALFSSLFMMVYSGDSQQEVDDYRKACGTDFIPQLQSS